MAWIDRLMAANAARVIEKRRLRCRSTSGLSIGMLDEGDVFLPQPWRHRSHERHKRTAHPVQRLHVRRIELVPPELLHVSDKLREDMHGRCGDIYPPRVALVKLPFLILGTNRAVGSDLSADDEFVIIALSDSS